MTFLLAQGDVEAAIRTKYEKKILMLRNFYQDGHLDYDKDGTVEGNPHVGSWTLARVEITKVKVKPQRLELEGIRIGDVYDNKQSKFVPILTKERVRIGIDLDTSRMSLIDVALSRVFLRDSERIADLVPPYWQAVTNGRVEDLMTSEGRPRYHIKGTDLLPNGPVSKSGPRVTPPRVVEAPDPHYTHIAKGSHYQGTTILQAEVKPEGRAENIQIVKALGLGLDDEAVRAVQQWKFEPARKNGDPVRVVINIEVNFRLN